MRKISFEQGASSCFNTRYTAVPPLETLRHIYKYTNPGLTNRRQYQKHLYKRQIPFHEAVRPSSLNFTGWQSSQPSFHIPGNLASKHKPEFHLHICIFLSHAFKNQQNLCSPSPQDKETTAQGGTLVIKQLKCKELADCFQRPAQV